ncbi:integrase, catalytic region, zinc finger, CCHC-type containing protein [Tanacetum coccineum]
MGITEGERGFEQTKTCYLTEVISFFKTIKEHFEEIQKALINGIKEIKEVFDQMEANVDQHVVDKKKAKEQLKEGQYIRELKEKISCLQKKHSAANPILDFKALDSQNKYLHAKVNALQDLNKRFRAENENAQIKWKTKCVTIPDHVKPKVLAPGMYAIDVELIPPRNRNNREVHLQYLKHLKESVGTLRKIVEEAKVEKPLDSSLASACLYTKHSQELLEYVIGTCSRDFNKRDRKISTAPLNRKMQVTFVEPGDKCTKLRVKQVKQVWQATGKLFTNVGFQWQPTRRKFTLGEQCPLTRFTKSKVVHVKQPESISTSEIVITERLSNTSQKPLTRVYYVEGLGHNLFSVGQFCDSDLEVAFRKHSCYVRTEDGVDLLKVLGAQICLPRLKFEKDHLCSACQLGKSKKYTHKPKSENTIMEVLHTLHMDLCGPIRVQSINGKKYILVIVDDYSRFTWVKFLRSKDEAPDFVIKFLKQIQMVLTKLSDTSERTRHRIIEDLEKLKAIADVRIFIGYAPNRKGYRIYNKRTHRIMETIHVQFDKLTEPMAPVHIRIGLEPILLTPGQISSGLVPDPILQLSLFPQLI